jgi:hypothetical protein
MPDEAHNCMQPYQEMDRAQEKAEEYFCMYTYYTAKTLPDQY